MAPAARCTSPHISLSPAAAADAKIAYKRNWPSCPPLISPAITDRVPIQSTKVMAPKINRIAIPVSNARTRIRRTAA